MGRQGLNARVAVGGIVHHRVMADGSEDRGASPHPDLLSSFGVLRRPARVVADLGDVRLLDPPIARFGQLASQARRVTVSQSDEAWVVPGTRGASLLHRGRTRDGGYSTGGWSGPVETVALRGLFGWSISLEGVETYYGLVPDGNPHVTLTLADGRRVAVAVVDNVFIVRPSAQIRTVEFLDAAGNPDSRRGPAP